MPQGERGALKQRRKQVNTQKQSRQHAVYCFSIICRVDATEGSFSLLILFQNKLAKLPLGPCLVFALRTLETAMAVVEDNTSN